MMVRSLFILLLFITFFCSGQQAKVDFTADIKSDVKLVNYNFSLSYLLDSLDLKKSDIRIVVSKSKYLLSIVKGTLIIKSYPVVFGFNPIDDKRKEGDGATPEGTFKVRALYPHKSWSKFIWFDYPNESSRLKHNQAKKQGLISMDSRIGGELGIHGVPAGSDYAIDQKQNWTLGCVSLKNKDVDEIYSVTYVGMEVEIFK
jgi:murein L,D-transpeptidase YafK